MYKAIDVYRCFDAKLSYTV